MPEGSSGIEQQPGSEYPISLQEAEEKELDWKIGCSGSIAESLRIIGKDLKNGLRVSSETVYTAKELQLGALLQLAISRERGPKKDISSLPPPDPEHNPLGIADTMEMLSHDENSGIRTKLDWLLIELAEQMARKMKVSGPNKVFKLDYNDFADLGKLWKTMTFEEREKEWEKEMRKAGLYTEMRPTEIIERLLSEGEKQHAIGEGVWEEKQKAEKFADIAFALKSTLDGVPTTQRINLNKLHTTDTFKRNGRLIFPEIHGLSFDSDKLAIAVINGKFADPQKGELTGHETVYLYYPHYKGNEIRGKTEFSINIARARGLLADCFEEKGLPEASIDAAINKYGHNVQRLPKERQQAFQYSIVEAIGKY